MQPNAIADAVPVTPTHPSSDPGSDCHSDSAPVAHAYGPSVAVAHGVPDFRTFALAYVSAVARSDHANADRDTDGVANLHSITTSVADTEPVADRFVELVAIACAKYSAHAAGTDILAVLLFHGCKRPADRGTDPNAHSCTNSNAHSCTNSNAHSCNAKHCDTYHGRA
jgi:hypothetical protein